MASKPPLRIENLNLTPIERNSSAWRNVSAHLRGELDILRLSNDSHQDAEATLKIRTAIALCKRLLAAGEQSQGLGDVVDDGDAIDEDRG